MTSIPAMFPFVGIIVLALAVILLAIWVARLSSKVKRLADAVMLENGQPHRQSSSQNPYGSYVASGPDYPYGSPARPVQPQARAMQGASGSQQAAVRRQQPAAASRQQASMQQAHAEASSGMRVAASAESQQAAYQDEEDEFFENYRDRSDGGQQHAKGRSKPSIPFGADKNVIDRRRETYTGSAADLDYDPDSIDFTRVQGYRNLYR